MPFRKPESRARGTISPTGTARVRKAKPAAAGNKTLVLKSPVAKPGGAKRVVDVARKGGSSWEAFAENGGIDPTQLAGDLGITKADLADTLGLPADALLRQERIMADKTQARLAEFIEILTRTKGWSGGLKPAFAWYRSQGIAALGDETAEAMVKTNRAVHVRTYLNAIAAGSFA